jgi:Co/Zn/Cd efflux system component
MGNVLQRVVRRYMPESDSLALIATALVIFLLSFAIVMGVLLRFGPAAEIGLQATLLISGLLAFIVTGLSAVLVRRSLQRANRKLDPEAHSFSVWDEDARKRGKNLRRR